MSSEITDHKHHFCQKDHGSISHLFSSRLVSKIYSRSQKKLKFYRKTLNSWPIDLKFCMMVVSGQENFLMSWVWKNLCTMGQNLIFLKILNFWFPRNCSTFNLNSIWLCCTWDMTFQGLSKSPWRLSSSWRFWNFSRTT